MLLVQDQQPKVLEFYILLEEPMGRHHDVDFPFRHPGQDGLLLFGRPKAAQHLDFYRVVFETLQEVRVVLLREHGRGDQDRHLLSVHDRLVGRPDRYLRLAETHVPAYEPVHGPLAFHVPEDRFDGPYLILGLLVRKRCLELVVGRVGFGEAQALSNEPCCIQGDELFRHGQHRLLHALLRPGPGRSPELVQAGRKIFRAHVLLDTAGSIHGQVELVSVRVLHVQVVVHMPPDVESLQASVQTDAEVDVHHVLLRFELVRVEAVRRIDVPQPVFSNLSPEDVLLVQEDKAARGHGESLGESARQEVKAGGISPEGKPGVRLYEVQLILDEQVRHACLF